MYYNLSYRNIAYSNSWCLCSKGAHYILEIFNTLHVGLNFCIAVGSEQRVACEKTGSLKHFTEVGGCGMNLKKARREIRGLPGLWFSFGIWLPLNCLGWLFCICGLKKVTLIICHSQSKMKLYCDFPKEIECNAKQ